MFVIVVVRQHKTQHSLTVSCGRGCVVYKDTAAEKNTQEITATRYASAFVLKYFIAQFLMEHAVTVPKPPRAGDLKSEP